MGTAIPGHSAAAQAGCCRCRCMHLSANSCIMCSARCILQSTPALPLSHRVGSTKQFAALYSRGMCASAMCSLSTYTEGMRCVSPTAASPSCLRAQACKGAERRGRAGELRASMACVCAHGACEQAIAAVATCCGDAPTGPSGRRPTSSRRRRSAETAEAGGPRLHLLEEVGLAVEGLGVQQQQHVVLGAEGGQESLQQHVPALGMDGRGGRQERGRWRSWQRKRCETACGTEMRGMLAAAHASLHNQPLPHLARLEFEDRQEHKRLLAAVCSAHTLGRLRSCRCVAPLARLAARCAAAACRLRVGPGGAEHAEAERQRQRLVLRWIKESCVHWFRHHLCRQRGEGGLRAGSKRLMLQGRGMDAASPRCPMPPATGGIASRQVVSLQHAPAAWRVRRPRRQMCGGGTRLGPTPRSSGCTWMQRAAAPGRAQERGVREAWGRRQRPFSLA